MGDIALTYDRFVVLLLGRYNNSSDTLRVLIEHRK